jgi:flavin-binding protein dodecin
LFSPDSKPSDLTLKTGFIMAQNNGTDVFGTLESKEANMAQKVIEIVGASRESFAKAAENAVAEAAKTVRGMKWARVAELEMALDGKKIAEYRATARIYFDVER